MPVAFGQQWSDTSCKSVHRLLAASEDDFRGIKVPSEVGQDFWKSKIGIAGFGECEGQDDSDPTISPSVSCTLQQSQSLSEVREMFQMIKSLLRSCLDRSFELSERNGGKAFKSFTSVQEARFEKKSQGESTDGPSVRLSLLELHSRRHSGYELSLWVDAKERE